MCCLFGCFLSLVKSFVGKFFSGGLEENNSLASLTSACVVSDVGAIAFFCVGGRLCHRGSERLSSLSDIPCQSSSFSAFRPRGFSDFTSSLINPPL